MTPLLIPAAFAYQLATCAPMVNVADAAAVARRESSMRTFDLMDNDDGPNGRSYRIDTYSDALRIGTALVRMGHRVDVGLLQVDSENFVPKGYSVADMLNPCTNAKVGGEILHQAYVDAIYKYHYAPGDQALWHAFAIYHTGRPDRGADYAQEVFTYAQSVTLVFPRPDAVMQQGKYFGDAPTVPLPYQGQSTPSLTQAQYVAWQQNQQDLRAQAPQQPSAHELDDAARRKRLEAYRQAILRASSHVPSALAPLVTDQKGTP